MRPSQHDLFGFGSAASLGKKKKLSLPNQNEATTMAHIVLTSEFAFQGNRALLAFVSRRVSIIKLILFCPPALHCSQSSLPGHTLPAWFTVRFGCFWLTVPAALCSVKKTARLHSASPPQLSGCTSSQMTGSWHTQPRLLSDPATPHSLH